MIPSRDPVSGAGEAGDSRNAKRTQWQRRGRRASVSLLHPPPRRSDGSRDTSSRARFGASRRSARRVLFLRFFRLVAHSAEQLLAAGRARPSHSAPTVQRSHPQAPHLQAATGDYLTVAGDTVRNAQRLSKHAYPQTRELPVRRDSRSERHGFFIA